jgi:hypothetical protein
MRCLSQKHCYNEDCGLLGYDTMPFCIWLSCTQVPDVITQKVAVLHRFQCNENSDLIVPVLSTFCSFMPNAYEVTHIIYEVSCFINVD